MKHLAHLIRHYRENVMQITQQDLAVLAGYRSDSSIRHFESGTRAIPVSAIRRITQALEIPAREVMDAFVADQVEIFNSNQGDIV